MPVKNRKKFTRNRGSFTHGCGSKKKRRGAGHKGGHGNAGTGKRADQKKPRIWQNPKYFGKYGFTPKNTITINAINIADIEETKDKLGSKEGDKYIIDLDKCGYNKLLGKGKATSKLDISVRFASAKAVEKIEAAGGSVKKEETSE